MRHSRWHRSLRNRREAEEVAVHNLLPVDGQGGSKPRARVVERRPARIEHQTIGEDQRILPNGQRMVTPYECGVLWADAREVELAGNQRRELDHRLVDHDDDEPIDVWRAAHVGGKIGTPRKYPAAVRLVRHESEGTVANRMRVPGGISQPGVRDALAPVRRQDCQIGEYG